MKLSVVAFTVTAAVVWALAVLLVGLANMQWPPYGQAFLDIIQSIYPGYDGQANITGVLVATGYAALDGLIAGLFFSLIYNCIACCCGSKCKTKGENAG